MTDLALAPWQYPSISRLDGRFVTVERLDPARDSEELYNLSHNPPEYQGVFTYMGYGPFPSQAAMLAWLTQVAEGSDPLYFSVLDKGRRQRVGMAALLNIVPAHGRAKSAASGTARWCRKPKSILR